MQQAQHSDLRMVTGFFDSRPPAERAAQELKEIGIPEDDVRVIAGSDGTGSIATEREDGGFWGSLRDLFLPESDRHVYAEGLNRGGYMVSALTHTREESEQAMSTLEGEGAVDLDERERSWRAAGWNEYTGAAVGRQTTDQAVSEERIPVAEEQLHVGKRDISSGRVRVRSYIVEEPVSETVSLRDERVHVERRPVDRAAGPNEDVFQDRSIEAEEHREEPVVGKETRVKEEVALSKEAGQRTEQVSDKVRRTKVDIEDERTGTKRSSDR
jgi:uncharacterized protein (TIGR02271 family)